LNRGIKKNKAKNNRSTTGDQTKKRTIKTRIAIGILMGLIVVSLIPYVSAQNSMAVGADMYWGTSVSQWNRYSDTYTGCGLTYVRLAFTPSSLSNLRSLVPTITADGVKVIGLLYNRNYDPDNYRGFGDWVYDVVSEFKDYVKVWEIWNEPNQNSFFSGKDPVKYTNFLKAGYTNAKAVDPTCTVLGVSLTWTHSGAQSFLRAVYEAGGKDYMDALASHPYCYPYAPEEHPSNPYTDLPKIKAVMEEYGDDNHIWITELGWSHGGEYEVSDSQQAEYLEEALELAKGWGWVDCLVIYSYKDSSGMSRQMGITSSSGTPHESYYAVKSFISGLPVDTTPTSTSTSSQSGSQYDSQDSTQTDTTTSSTNQDDSQDSTQTDTTTSSTNQYDGYRRTRRYRDWSRRTYYRYYRYRTSRYRR
jgi:hypothetical protein